MPHYLLFRYGCHGISISHRYDNDVNRSKPLLLFPPIWKILAKIPPLSAHCISKRAYFHVNYFRISARKCFVGKKKKRKKGKKIFLSNDGFLIYSTLSISTRDASRWYILPSFSTIKFYANLSKNIDNSDKTTVRNRIGLYIETLNRSLARNLSALIINAMFNAYFAMLITRLTPVTSRTV